MLQLRALASGGPCRFEAFEASCQDELPRRQVQLLHIIAPEQLVMLTLATSIMHRAAASAWPNILDACHTRKMLTQASTPSVEGPAGCAAGPVEGKALVSAGAS